MSQHAAVRVPDGLEARRALGEPWVSWLDRLPGLAREVLAEWELSPDGPAMHGHCSLVLPVRRAEGELGVLKLALPDAESEHEALALQRWAGDGAVRMLRADPARRAMLLERLGRRTLAEEWDVQACELVGQRYARLHLPAPPQLRLLSDQVARWTASLAALPAGAPLPHRLVEQAVSLGRELTSDPGERRLLHTDLHYDNVLAGEREEWLVIDPKPLAGDPHYEVAPLLWNRWDELAGDVRAGVRRRFHAVVDAAGLDEERARDWVVVRMLHNALWGLRDDPGQVRRGTRELLTVCVAVAKAVQD
ncbi:aminoglycoside phosphotransferase family protein [Nocardioides campestrisoli]|uniref:aminoglycoside phosphotransferase family protein n=1 Tax=Nocardioides campestrisoli TaxID=2736757 RepID=UPI0015E73775|nr:aminoglycoside phosphotransferase family protein [Nocardioides campestrisoli]